MTPAKKQIEKLEQYAVNAKKHAEAYGLEGDAESSDKLSMQSCIFDCTVAICTHLADLADAITDIH